MVTSIPPRLHCPLYTNRVTLKMITPIFFCIARNSSCRSLHVDSLKTAGDPFTLCGTLWCHHARPLLSQCPLFYGGWWWVHVERGSQLFQGYCCISVLPGLVLPDALHCQASSKCPSLTVVSLRVRRRFAPILCHVSSPGHCRCPLCTFVPHRTFE